MTKLVRKLGYVAAFSTDRHGRVLGLSFADILFQGGIAILFLLIVGSL